jgi:steroid delta-isomerase-like uncharacterized protein
MAGRIGDIKNIGLMLQFMNNETILKDFIEQVWNKKDFSVVEALVDNEYTVYKDNGDPWEGKTIGHDEYKIRLRYSFDSFPDMHFAIQSSVADGDLVAITWIMTGTNLGNIVNIPPTQKKIETFGTTIYQLNNGKVCGHTQVFDRTTVMKQLGFLP